MNHHDVCRKSGCSRFYPVPRGGTATLFCLRNKDKTIHVEACVGENYTITETSLARLIYDMNFKPPHDCKFLTEHLMVGDKS